ncbi:MAG: hypothetical protein L3J37_01685 [Rhodobacteraceae bacterium]|nr:hypothetical protein [Paracoccaceae bacterium]
MDQTKSPNPGVKMRKVKVFGERNTGTSAVMQMLGSMEGVSTSSPRIPTPDIDRLEEKVMAKLEGFYRELYIDALLDESRSRNRGLSAWKHAAPVLDDSYAEKSASVLFLVRDPYSWAVSMYRQPYHKRAPKAESLLEFLDRPWLCMARDNLRPVLESPLDLWSGKLRAYRVFSDVGPVPSTVLQFEDFVQAPVFALGAALAVFGIGSDGLAEIPRPTKPDGMEAADRRAYYAGESWKSSLDPAAATLINERIDWDVARSFGYAPRDPADFSR